MVLLHFLKPIQEVVKLAQNNRVPIVILGREGDDIGVDSVYTDDYNGSYLMGKYLMSRHYNKVGYIGAPQDIMCSVKRYEGLAAYYKEQGQSINENYLIYIEHYMRDFHKYIDYLVREEIKAIFCF